MDRIVNSPGTISQAIISRYIDFDRGQWKALRANTPLLLEEQELTSLRGINEQVSLREVEDIYIPLSRLLNLHVAAVQHLNEARLEFMGAPPLRRVPYIIGIAGSVAVGKSTFSRVLRACLARWPDHPRVDLVTTDGFLYPNEILEQRGLMNRKGFPESYDQRRLLHFLAEIKAGGRRVSAPVYSHLHYNIVPNSEQIVDEPDILILEGLNVLQSPDTAGRGASRVFVSDFFDFSIYLDAAEPTIRNWYIQRFLKLRETVFQNAESYFHRFAALKEAEAIETARTIWEQINLVNLEENIRPTRERAHLILEKQRDHMVERVRLRRV
jgi:type I pantothenate kinase